ncbi:MAG TPA: pentapeptide repeat-containing protein [Methylophaga aminisulfidivorans]|uniref:pentapeptide repeat-containing protein n=1 Tax=Methylophaga aminisulfidivorans TaxID=230105 RepID=UPI001A172601|nr:pentapeptide repeat-containing protein [Methylophaga aminisulfidivorans]
MNQNSYFCSAVITNCNLSYANLSRAGLESCKLSGNRWTEANLSGTTLQGADLSRGEVSPEGWYQCQLQNADLRHCDLVGLDIRRVDVNPVAATRIAGAAWYRS